jgi:glucose-6-phosphate isomerase
VTIHIEVADSTAYGDLVQELVDDKIASRIAAQDPTLWGPDAESEASIRLSWPTLSSSSRPLVEPILALRDKLKAAGVDRVVLAGMGGSSLAPEVICAHAKVPLIALDTTDAGQVRAALDPELLEATVLVASSKSGGTVETDSHRRVFEQAFRDAGIDPVQRIVVVTDPGSPLEALAKEAGYPLFLADPHVGGRYSALTAFGLVPAGLAGVDIAALLDEADSVADTFASDIAENPALHLGSMIGLAHNAGRDKLVLADHGSGIPGFGDWAEQLIAESTGKLGKGVLPVVTEGVDAVGFANAGDDAIQVTLGPTFPMHTPFAAAVDKHLGGQFLLWEYAIAIAGRIIGINPFDQPNVEEAKAQARQLLDNPAGAGSKAVDLSEQGIEATAYNLDLAGVGSIVGAIDALLAAAPERGYLSIQAYLDRHVDATADDLRPALAHRGGLQTTFGWGPRFLHSTGQYHKGGHQNGVFLQITGSVSEDLAVPDRPYTFASLQAAQAAGDAAVLAAKGRPVLHLHLTDRASGLGHLLEHL